MSIQRQVRVIPATRQENRQQQHRGRLRVAAYCRVSTDNEEQLNSYQAQKSYYSQTIQEKDEWELAGIYADEGISGTSTKKRKEFNRMIAACKRGSIDLVITKSLSRFARNTVDCLETVRMLKANGIGVIFEKENINTLTESSEFLITLFSGFAQAESESLSKNITWGRQKSMEAGKAHFNYGTFLGYQKGPDGKPEIVPKEAEIVRLIYRRYLEGASIRIIKAELEAQGILAVSGGTQWSEQVIRNILASERYIGDVLLQKSFVSDPITKQKKKNRGERPMYYIENHHPAIIPRTVYAQVQAERTRRGNKRKVMQKSAKTEQGKYSSKFALTEVLVCGECGSPYRRVTWSRNGTKRIVWRCTSRLEFGTKFCKHSPTMPEEQLHQMVHETIQAYAESSTTIQQTLMGQIKQVLGQRQGTDGTLLHLQSQLEGLSAKQEALLELVLENMDDPELAAQMKEIVRHKEQLQSQIEAMEGQSPPEDTQSHRVDEVQAWLDEYIPHESYSDELVRQAVERITVVDAESIVPTFKV